MNLTHEQEAEIDFAMDYAEAFDRSIEWGIQHASDMAKCDISDVVKYLLHIKRISDMYALSYIDIL